MRAVSSPAIDVIVPVYRGVAETRTCIESVLACPTRVTRQVVVIDDASPEPELSAWLRELAEAGRIALIAHPENAGFVASTNEAMALHRDRDVVLLNSDTEVAPGWLDRIAACARRDPAIGTVTPFSNNATICSYPRTLVNNAIPPGETTASLDAAFAAANAGRAADIVTAVGFCMYITRRCLERVGLFDYERYGAGYGEEVDFCMRAARAGFRNVIAADAFVRHVGEVSFSGTDESSDARRAKAQVTVDALYPEFEQQLQVFIPSDPLRALRRRADLERLRKAPGQMSREESGGKVRLAWERPGEDFVLWLDAARDRAALQAIERLLSDPRAPIPEIDPRWLDEPLESAHQGSGTRP